MPIFINKHWKAIAIILVGTFTVSYLTFRWFAWNGPFIASDIGKSDWLAFWGSLLSTSGTVFLGWVAIAQNNRLHKLEENSFKAQHATRITKLKSIDYRIVDSNSFKNLITKYTTIFEAYDNIHCPKINCESILYFTNLELIFEFIPSFEWPIEAKLNFLTLSFSSTSLWGSDGISGKYLITSHNNSGSYLNLQIQDNQAILETIIAFSSKDPLNEFIASFGRHLELEIEIDFRTSSNVITSTKFRVFRTVSHSTGTTYQSTLTKCQYTRGDDL